MSNRAVEVNYGTTSMHRLFGGIVNMSRRTDNKEMVKITLLKENSYCKIACSQGRKSTKKKKNSNSSFVSNQCILSELACSCLVGTRPWVWSPVPQTNKNQKTERQTINWKNVFTNYLGNKGFDFSIERALTTQKKETNDLI